LKKLRRESMRSFTVSITQASHIDFSPPRGLKTGAKPAETRCRRLQDSAVSAAVNGNSLVNFWTKLRGVERSPRASSSRQQIRFYYNCVMMVFCRCPDTREQGYSAHNRNEPPAAPRWGVFYV
jgi:hypothetical protein